MKNRRFPSGYFQYRSSIRDKIFFVCVVLAVVVSLASTYATYEETKRALRSQLRQQLKMLSATIASQLDANLLASIRTPEDKNIIQYKTLYRALKKAQLSNPNIVKVYTMRKTSNPFLWQFVVVASSNSEETVQVGEYLDVRNHTELRRAYLGPTAEKEPSSGRWDTFLSGYAPIKNESGFTVGIVGVDVSLRLLHEQESLLLSTAAFNFLLAMAIAYVLSFIVTRILLRPVKCFINAAERIHGGDLNFSVPVISKDEIGDFASAFNEMIRDLNESREKLMDQGARDSVTSLYNHTFFQERLEVEIKRAKRSGQELCVIILDIDRLKNINDSYGFIAGAEVIKQLASLIRSNIRSHDIAARYGGDEFALVLVDCSESLGKATAERLRKEVENYEFSVIDPETRLPVTVRLTVTMGIASFPTHHNTRDGLVMAADIALCRAKQLCRNSVFVYEPFLDEKDGIGPDEMYRILRDPNAGAVRSLAAAVDAKDPYTRGHSERVSEYSALLAEALWMPLDDIESIKVTGLLHDIGKIGVPDEILNKQGTLTDLESETVRLHPAVGRDILRHAPQLERAIKGVLHHHERWDGMGYPDGLKGEEIPIEARILAIADAFDAMTSDRPYRDAMSLEQALHELRLQAGKQFDPELVQVFIHKMRTNRQSKAA